MRVFGIERTLWCRIHGPVRLRDVQGIREKLLYETKAPSGNVPGWLKTQKTKPETLNPSNGGYVVTSGPKFSLSMYLDPLGKPVLWRFRV